MAAHTPRRRCVGCGRIAAKSELIRIARERKGATTLPRAMIDRAGTMPGRGAYVCAATPGGIPARACLERATRRGGLARVLRGPVSNVPELLESMTR